MLLSASRVLKTKARVRRPGSSPAVTASAAVRRTSRSGCTSRESPASSGILGAVELDPDRRGQLGEEAHPCRPAGRGLGGQQLLLGLAQHVGPPEPSRLEMMAVRGECGCAEQLCGAVVVDRQPLELEPDQLGAELRRPLLDLRHQGAVGRIAHVGGEPQRGVVGGPVRGLEELGLVARASRRCRRRRRRRASPWRRRSARRPCSAARSSSARHARRRPGRRRAGRCSSRPPRRRWREWWCRSRS